MDIARPSMKSRLKLKGGDLVLALYVALLIAENTPELE
jgi:hypothetical protein